MKRLRSNLTYANVMATIAVFLVLAGGTAFAASQMLPKNSVGSKQIKKAAVTPAKLSTAAKKTLTGPKGATGPQGAPGKEGAPGQNLTATTPLASGVTEAGVFAAAGGGPGAATGQILTAVVNFVQPLPQPLDKAHVIIVPAAQTSATHCPGAGKADPGYFCAYVGYEDNAYLYSKFEDPQTGEEGAGINGANAYGETGAPGGGGLAGTWAVTAP